MRPSKDRDTLRPFRIYDAWEQKQVPGRWYIFEKSAERAAVVLAYESLKSGRTYEVLNVRNMTLRATYTRHRTSGNIIIKDYEQLKAEERNKYVSE